MVALGVTGKKLTISHVYLSTCRKTDSPYTRYCVALRGVVLSTSRQITEVHEFALMSFNFLENDDFQTPQHFFTCPSLNWISLCSVNL